MIEFTGKINGLDYYNRIKIIVDDPSVVVGQVNDIKNPYKFIDNKLECYIVSMKHKQYYLDLVRDNVNKMVKVTVVPRKYSFDGKKGTTFLLKYLELIDI